MKTTTKNLYSIQIECLDPTEESFTTFLSKNKLKLSEIEKSFECKISGTIEALNAMLVLFHGFESVDATKFILGNK